MKLLLATTASALLLAGSAFARDDDDAKRNIVAEYDFDGFDTIDVEGVYKLDVRQGERFSVRTEATEIDARWLEVMLDGDTLVLGQKDRDRRNWNKNEQSHAVLAIVTLPRLKALDVTGVATGEIAAFDGGTVEIDVAGVTDLTLSGTCDVLDIDVDGVGDVDARDLRCDTVRADLSGVGEMSVHALERIEADADGIGQINVYGDPEDRITESGFMSKVRFRS